MTSYLLTDIGYIQGLLGSENSVEFTTISGKLRRKLRIKLIGNKEVDILVNDYDGSLLVLRACLRSGFATLICPFLSGSEYEELVVKLILSYVSEKL